MRRQRQSQPHNTLPFPLILVMVLAVIIKAPILLLLAVLAIFFFGGLKLAMSGMPKKRKAVPAGPPSIVKIDGVGDVEWITDPSQLDHGRMLSMRDLKKLENEVLCSPADWIEMGEKVATSEEEAANKPAPPPPPRPKGHNVMCRCPECRVLWGGQDQELFAEERVEPIARIRQKRYDQKRLPRAYGGRQFYAKGGIVKYGERTRLVDHMERRWM